MARPTQRLFHLVFEPHNGRALVPIPERSASPRATSNTAVVDGLKVLDPKRPIREADIGQCSGACGQSLLWRLYEKAPSSISNSYTVESRFSPTKSDDN